MIERAGLRPSGHDLQLAGHRRLAPPRGARRGRPLLLLEGARRARAVRRARGARAARLRADPPAAPARRPSRPSGRRRDAGGRDEHGLARDGGLEGAGLRRSPTACSAAPAASTSSPATASSRRGSSGSRSSRPRTGASREITVIVDRNQRPVRHVGLQVSDLGDLEAEGCARSAGRSPRCDGHDLASARRDARGARRRGAAEAVIARHAEGRRRLVHGAARPAAHRHRAVRLPLRRADAGASTSEAVEEIRTRLDARLARLGRGAGRAGRGRAARARLRPASTASASSRPTARRSSSRPSASRGSSRSTPTCARLRPGRLPRALPGALLRVRDRRAGHGLAGRGDGARGPPAGRPLVRLLPLDAAERADLQQRDRGLEGHLRRLARRPRPGRAWPLAPVGARHLGARRDAGHGADRAVLASGGARGRRVGRQRGAGPGLPPARQRAAGRSASSRPGSRSSCPAGGRCCGGRGRAASSPPAR